MPITDTTTPTDFAEIIEPLAELLFGEPNRAMSSEHEWRYGARGSLCIDLAKGTWFDHEVEQGGGVLDLVTREKGLTGEARIDWLQRNGFLPDRSNGAHPPRAKIVATYDYTDEAGALLFQVCRYAPKDFRQRKPDGNGGWSWSVKGIRRVPYRLQQVLETGDKVICIVEGEKGADDLARIGVPATTNAGGAGKWSTELSEFFHGADVVVIPDYDAQKRHPKTGEPMFHDDGRPILPGQDHAQAVALALSRVAARVRVLELWRSWPEMPAKGDVSDWIKAGGTAEALYALIDALPDWTKQADAQPKGRFELVHIDEIEPGDEPPWLINEILPAGPALAVVFGAPKTRKTLLVADILFHVAMGRTYCGRDTQQGAVVYITTEGARGFRERMTAMRQHYGIKGVPFYTITNVMPQLGIKPGDAEALTQDIKRALPQGVTVAVVVIDTLARAMTGQSDADGRDMGVFVENCDHIAKAFKALIVVIHHSPRSDATRTRGSNVLDGAADALISVVADGAISTATVEALKDGEPGLTWHFRVALVEIEQAKTETKKGGFGPLCETIGTPARKDDSETRAKPNLAPAHRRFIDILAEALLDVGETVPASNMIPFGIRAVTREQLKKALQMKGFLDGYKSDDSARAGMSKVINQLAGKHVIGTTMEHVWLPR
ncbi:AAA family ATPase [Frankia sp. RB7]|nr:AAA family ATPase [Frankia sp. RB7]